ncbi:caspase family protein [Sandarakinorhabdus sp. AAP62]|uniref:caspase family protein n=1 Tax=Sandarakinorhabdus sp. AAP62 TaxID=1248916 RepID=UPI0003125A94|nr:caspase family protein [Sandarakinorhabdus sp. AAP62]
MKKIIAATMLLLGSGAQAEVRAVFVGIDKYAYGAVQPPNLRFADLSGAVGDTRRIRDALASSHGLAVGTMPDGDNCKSQGPAALTLINACATKAAILAAWQQQLAASKPGDTLLLYFAGHGSTFLNEDSTQASGYNSTLMPHDARRPQATALTDIMDSEIRVFINRATSTGVNVVTWFDSCNSGTASRDGNSASRSAPPLRVSQPLEKPMDPSVYGNLGAYRVHMGGAADGQDATEVGQVGARAGRFTTALAKALTDTPNASFADLAMRVVGEVTRDSGGRQVPHAEGALRATLGGPEVKAATFDVVVDGSRLVMAGGRLTGVTKGSRFALFTTTGEALGGGKGLTARVADLGPGQAVLVPEAPLPPGWPAVLVAREIGHVFDGPKLPLAVADPAALAIVQRLNFVAVDPAGRFRLQPAAGGLQLSGPTGRLALLPPARDPQFGVQLAAALEKVARVEHWQAQATQRPGVILCVRSAKQANGETDAAWCRDDPPPTVSLTPSDEIQVSVINASPKPRHLYVLAIGDKYSVTLVLPGFGARERAIQAGRANAIPPEQKLTPEGPGRLRFVALSTDGPVNASALEQSDTDQIDPHACLSAVAGAFCQSENRARSGAGGAASEWSVAVVDAEVKP